MLGAWSLSAWSLNLERETGIEPATNSLEGCDSTTELLPPSRLAPSRLPRRSGEASPRAIHSVFRTPGWPAESKPARRTSTWLPNRSSQAEPRAKAGGEGRTRTFEATRATDLQSAAFDRSATSPVVCVGIVDFDAYSADRTLVSFTPPNHPPESFQPPERPTRNETGGAGEGI